MELLLKIKDGSISPDAFFKELWNLSDGLKRNAFIWRTANRIYRTRTFSQEERPELISELSYPPVDKIKLGRANGLGEQIFYASANTPLTIREARVTEGHFIIMSEWHVTQDLVLQAVGINEKENPSDVENICRHIFTSAEDNTYPYSSMIAKYLMSGKQIGGLIYPSVITKNTSHNLAIKKEFVDNNLRFANCALYRIDKIVNDMTFNVTELDFASPGANGSLNWKGRIRTWTGGPNTPTPDAHFVFNGWYWDAFTPAGTYVEPDN